jgi:Protein of unknown function (DUF3298)
MMRTLCLAVSTLIGALAALTEVAVAGAQSGCADLSGNVQSGNVCRAYRATPAYILDLRFRTDYVDGQPVTDYLTQERDRLVNAAQMPSARNLPYKLIAFSDYYTSGQRLSTTQPELGYGEPPNGTQSLVLRFYPTVDGVSVEDKFKSFTYNLNQNRPVTFENLFAPGTNPIDTIYPAVAADVERQQHARNFKLAPSIGRDPAHYQNFAITDDAVIFFFHEGELLTREAGDVRATVPRAILPALQL